MERIVSVPKPGEDASQEEIDAYNAAYRQTWREQVSRRTDGFMHYYVHETDPVYYIGEDDATVICEIPVARLRSAASDQSVIQIDLAGAAAEEPDVSRYYSPELIEYLAEKPDDAWVVISFDIQVPSMEEIVEEAQLVRPDDGAPVEERSAYYEAEWIAMQIAYANAKQAFYDAHLVKFQSQSVRSEYYHPTLWIQTKKSGVAAFVGLEEITSEIRPGLDWKSPAYAEIFAPEAPDSPLRRKLDPELYLYMQGKPDDVLIPIHFNLRGLSKAEILARAQLTEPEAGAPYAEVQAYGEALSAEWRAANAEIAQNFVREHLDERANVVLSGLEMIVEVPKSQIAGLATLSEITSGINLDLQRSPYAYPAIPDDPVNYDALKQAIAEAGKLNLNDYTSSTANAVSAALEDARAALESEYQQAVDAATEALKHAVAALELAPPPPTEVDKSQLVKAIEEYTIPPLNYTYETCKAYNDAYNNAIAVNEKEDASQDEVDAAVSALKAALAALKTPDFAALDAAIKAAEEIDRTKYTDESLTAMDQALNAARSFERDTPKQADIDATAKALEDAIIALPEKQHVHDYTAVVTAPTCTEAGFTTHTCACGDSYVDSEVAALGHDFKDGKCTRCGVWDPVSDPSEEPPEYHTETSVEKMIEWIKAQRATPAEDWAEWSSFLKGASKASRLLTVRPATEECNLETIMAPSTQFCLDNFFRKGDDRIEVIIRPLNTPLDAQIARINSDWTAEYENLQYAKSTATIGGRDTAVYFLDGGSYERKDSGGKEQMPPTAIFEWEGHEVTLRGLDDLYGAKWNNAWIDLFCWELVSLAKYQFLDVTDESKFYFEPVYWAVEKGITKGTSETLFSPDAGCTRAQVVTFLWRAAGEPEPTKTENPFKDVKETDYFCKAVLWAVEKGITMGTSADRFSPEKTCTRAQAVTFLYRAEGQPGPLYDSLPFGDISPSDYFFPAVGWAVANGVTRGTSEYKFSPEKTCTRGEIVTFLYRASLGKTEPIYKNRTILYVTCNAPYTVTNAEGASFTYAHDGKTEGDLTVFGMDFLPENPVTYAFVVSNSETFTCATTDGSASIQSFSVIGPQASGTVSAWITEEAGWKTVSIDASGTVRKES